MLADDGVVTWKGGLVDAAASDSEDEVASPLAALDDDSGDLDENFHAPHLRRFAKIGGGHSSTVSRVINSNDPVPCIPPLFSDSLTGATIWNMECAAPRRAHAALPATASQLPATSDPPRCPPPPTKLPLF